MDMDPLRDAQFLRGLGYARCTSRACNCGSWHLSPEGEAQRDARDARLRRREDREFILCAAIYVDTGKPPPGSRTRGTPETGIVFAGLRHGDCYGPLIAWSDGLTDAEKEEIAAVMGPEYEAYGSQLFGRRQGFLTSTGRFVDRDEAAPIAVAAGQTGARGRRVETDHLFSEDLY